MICPKCNNSIGDSECICGNCGYNVRDDVDVALMQCISISGKDIYNNSNKFNALIADLLPKNEKERNALSNALKANVSIYILIITMPVLMKSFQILWVRCVNLHLQSLLGLDMQLLSFPRRWGYLFRRNMTRL